MTHRVLKTISGRKGQTLAEYAIILVLIAIVVLVMVRGIGNTTRNSYSKVNSALQ